MDVIAQYIPDLFTPIFSGVTADMGQPVYYRWGHKKEIDADLKTRDVSKVKSNQRFPLAWLVMDFDEFKGDNLDVYTKTKFSFVFAVTTKIDYTQEQRRDNSFLPLLLPMYASFLNRIGQSTTFRMPDAASIKHTMRLRPYWGDGGTNLFADYVDCIEIVNLSLDIRRLNCIKK